MSIMKSHNATLEYTCLICGGRLNTNLLIINEPDRFERYIGIFPNGYRRSWVTCNNCGSATNDFNSSGKDRLRDLEAAYYSVDLAEINMADRYRAIMSIPPEKSDNMQRVDRVLSFTNAWLPRKSFSILDIGAGTGVFLSRMMERARAQLKRAVAIEPDPDAAQHLLELGMFEVVNEKFPLISKVGSFDLVTLNKVLEHIANPIPFLNHVHDYLSDTSGILYIEVPDSLTALYRPPTDNILGSLHRHLYTPVGLGIALSQAGFEVIRIERVAEPSGKISIYAFATLRVVLEKRIRGGRSK